MRILKDECRRLSGFRQRGLALFFALIALLALSLAAAALIRSVDTSTLIAGNLAFKQSATSSGDAGIEAAITWLSAVDAANRAINVITDPRHPFNVDDAASGYYSNLDTTLDVFSEAPWAAITKVAPIVDASSNTIQYIVQRVCRTANQEIKTAECLFSSLLQDKNAQNIPLLQEICQGAGCPAAGQSPQIRITSRIQGPRNTLSYVQAFVY